MKRSKKQTGGFDFNYEKILDALHEDIVIVDRDQVIIKVSDSFERMYGMPGSEAVGKTLTEMEDRGIFNPSTAKPVFLSGKRTIMSHRNKYGDLIVVTVVPIKDEAGAVETVVSFSLNMDELVFLKEEYEHLEQTLQRYNQELQELRSRFSGMEDSEMRLPDIRKITDLAGKAAKYDVTVLLTGESGVGKTVMARKIHSQSSRSSGPFIEINCGAIPEHLLESELFGYVKGAFTGANSEGKAGLIEMAEGGTLFLDEVSELSLGLQVKILKAIQDKTITRVGGTAEKKIDFRLITAANKDLAEMAEEGRFRRDLFYRLNVMSINIPPLRERPRDTQRLMIDLVEKNNLKYNEQKKLNLKVFDLLLHCTWPGNIRELENVIERMIITSEGDLITETDIPAYLLQEAGAEWEGGCGTLPERLESLERRIILDAVKCYRTTTRVAEALGISQSSAARKIAHYRGKGG